MTTIWLAQKNKIALKNKDGHPSKMKMTDPKKSSWPPLTNQVCRLTKTKMATPQELKLQVNNNQDG